MFHRPPPPTKQPTEESGNWPALVITGREPAEMGTEGHQTKGQPARGGKTPGRARGDGHRRAPDERTTGSRRENAGASPRRWAQRDTGGRNDGLASEQLSGKRTKRRMGFRLSEHFFASVTKTRRRGGRAKAKMHGQAGHDAGRRQAGGARVPYSDVRVQ